MNKDEEFGYVVGDYMVPFETPDMPEDDEEDIDPFAELEIGTAPKAISGLDALESLVDDSDETDQSDDLLAAFEEDDDDFEEPLLGFGDESAPEEVVIGFEEDSAPEPAQASTPQTSSAESTYRLLLETVWVDDILDPSEVELLARKRGELGISFEHHLSLVRDIIGG